MLNCLDNDCSRHKRVLVFFPVINKIHSGYLNYLHRLRAWGLRVIKAFRVFPRLLGETYGQRATGTCLTQPLDSYLLSAHLPGTAGSECLSRPRRCGKTARNRSYAPGAPSPSLPLGRMKGPRRGELGPPVRFRELFWVFSQGTSLRVEVGPAPGHFPRRVPSWCQERIKPLKTSDVRNREGN